jgi:hypothetical protein
LGCLFRIEAGSSPYEHKVGSPKPRSTRLSGIYQH